MSKKLIDIKLKDLNKFEAINQPTAEFGKARKPKGEVDNH
jgi:hypothetical protein